MTSDARREPTGEEGLSSKSEAAKLADTDHSTAQGLAVDPFGVVTLEAELTEILGRPVTFATEPAPSTQAALSDAARMAQVLRETFGPAWCRSLITELERRVVVSDG